MVYGAGEQGFMQKLRSCCACGACDWSTIRDFIRHAPEQVIKAWFELVGESADDRTKGDTGMLIAIPFIIFVLLAWIGWILRHFNAVAFVMIAGIALCIALGFVLLGVT